MASPFQKYQSEQVQQIPAGYVEAMGSMGRAYASIGQSIAGGIQEADKRAEQEQITKGKLAVYLRGDPRTLAVERGISDGLLIKDADGIVSVAPSKESLVDPKVTKPYLDYYNTTGGDGSKLEGRGLTRFVAEYEEQEKVNKTRQATAIEAEKAKIDNDLKRAQIADLQSKALERQANAGLYGSTLQGMGFGTAPAAGGGVPATTTLFNAYNAPPAGTLTLNASTPQPVDPTGTLPLSTAYTGPTSEPQAVATTTPAPATTAAAPAAAAEPVYTPEDFDAKGYLKKKPAPAAEQPNVRKDAEIKPGQSTQAVAPAVAPAAPAVAPVKAAPVVYDIPAKTEETNKILKGLDDKRAATIKTYSTKRIATQANFETAKKSAALPANQKGLSMAQASLDYNKTILEGIDDAEKRDLGNIDAEAQSAKTSLKLYTDAADAQRAARTDTRLEKAETRAEKAETRAGAKFDMDKVAAAEKTTLESSKLRRLLVKDYPIKGVFSHLGYNLRDKSGKLMDPAELGTAGLTAQEHAEVDATYDGFIKATDFLVRMDDISERRGQIGGEWSQRFRLLAKDMENYFQGELASTFGVATFRRAIVSGGNFSDADREFVKAAITYLNTAAPDMDQADLKASTRALATFINAMYQRGLESRNMRYSPENAKKQADAYRALGDNGGAGFLEGQIRDSEMFYNRFAMKPTKDTYTKEFGTQVDEARAVLWGTLSKGKAIKNEFAGSNPTLQRNPSSR
jgi:hypothetical protein